METRLFYIHALTALHVGTGQGIDVIDLPIARDGATGLPMVPGSGLKGVLRDELSPLGEAQERLWTVLFGPEPRQAEEAEAHAGALALGDAQLLCLPVRSAFGTFAWVTSPWVLRRYRRDLAFAGGQAGEAPTIPTPAEGEIAVSTQSVLPAGDGGPVILEELDLEVDVQANEAVERWAEWIAQRVFAHAPDWAGLFRERFAVVADGILDFLAETATEVRARVRIDPDTRTVARGALWYEENLPPETILWGWLGCSRARRRGDERDGGALLQALRAQLDADGELRLQLGGKASVGRGQVRWILPEVEA